MDLIGDTGNPNLKSAPDLKSAWNIRCGAEATFVDLTRVAPTRDLGPEERRAWDGQPNGDQVREACVKQGPPSGSTVKGIQASTDRYNASARQMDKIFGGIRP